ncbi:MAG: hypothetical protein ACRDO1_15130 [Nocardioidaceae bacterium]
MTAAATAPTVADLRWGRVLVLLAVAATLPLVVWLLLHSADFGVFSLAFLVTALCPLLARRESTFRLTCWLAAALMLIQSIVFWFTGEIFLLFSAGIVFVAPWAMANGARRTPGPWIWLAVAVCLSVAVMTVGSVIWPGAR